MNAIVKLKETPRIMKSNTDQSINWIFPKRVGSLEARYVRRDNRYFVVYLSSQSGCAQSCRMCFLTASRQVKLINATLEDFFVQAEHVFDWYTEEGVKAEVVHFNFMARGEPLENPSVLHNSTELLSGLADLATSRELLPRYLVSTILPKSFKGNSLVKTFPVFQPEIFYSLYSMNDSFRKRWVPKALPAEEGLALLKEWQDHSAKIPKIHYAFIEGENDSTEDVEAVCRAINDIGLRVDINIVRYNPFSPRHGVEPPETIVQRNGDIFERQLPHAKIRIVPRVGYDVSASCGMFVK